MLSRPPIRDAFKLRASVPRIRCLTVYDVGSMELRPLLHLLLHVLVPGAVAGIWFRAQWRRAWLWMLAGWIIDLDHLLADPIYAPGRCSIGFHPLHTAPAVLGFGVLAAWPRTRLLGLGLLIHIALDALDCVLMM